ncbi:MAG: hypothetical protein IGS03_13700 [Candidatus Sericytochromatia bacterium]|nr:hypothetical protein [Candidatus Sericytochromatia bacterium]
MLKKYPLVICLSLSLGLSACPLPGEVMPPAPGPEPTASPTAALPVTPTPVPTAEPTATPDTPVPTVSPEPLPTATPMPTPSPELSPEPGAETLVLFENYNILGVQNQPLNPTTFTLTQSARITHLETYHWNSAQGKPGGTIGLRAADGTMYGPWPVTTQPGQGGVPNAYWIAVPNQDLPAGTYTVVDSDPASWAHNSANGNQGMTQVKGQLLSVVVPEPTPEATLLFENHNILAVQNQPLNPTVFTLSQSARITELETYHWNSAQGKPGGTIGLRAADGTMYGPWSVTTRPGQGGVPNAYWLAEPNQNLPAGTYTVVDSDPASWAHNSANGNQGMTQVKGYLLDASEPVLPEANQWGEEKQLFENGNILAVQNTPISPTRFTLTRTTQLTYLETYHWNNAQGAPGGTLALLDSKGTYYGPWPVSTRPGQGGVPNAYWYVELSLILPPETYTVVDSDTATWSHNNANGNQGMTLIKGREADMGVSQS